MIERRTDFSRRAHTPELMDTPCSYQDFHHCLADLAKVNRLTLAYRPTLRWLRQIGKRFGRQDRLRIVDVGSGYGDMLRQIAADAARRNQPVQLTGVDLNPHAAPAAASVATPHAITWRTGNVFDLPDHGIDIVISALFTHHLTDNEIVRFIRWMERTAMRGWFISDLHRHPVPYHVFRLWARLAGWHRFVRHDGPVSITRAFTRADWQRLCAEAGLNTRDVAIRWRFPFRICVARTKS